MLYSIGFLSEDHFGLDLGRDVKHAIGCVDPSTVGLFT